MLATEDDELELELDCLAHSIFTGKKYKEKRSMIYEYKFNNLQESKIKEGDQVKIKSDTNLNAEVFSMDLDGGRFELKSTSDLPNDASLILFKHVSAKKIEQSIEAITNNYYEKGFIKPCLKTFFDKKRPAFKQGSNQASDLTSWGKNILESSKDYFFYERFHSLHPSTSWLRKDLCLCQSDCGSYKGKIGIASNSHKV